jgi:hypothetical protein
MICATALVSRTPVSLRNRGSEIYAKVIDALYNNVLSPRGGRNRVSFAVKQNFSASSPEETRFLVTSLFTDKLSPLPTYPGEDLLTVSRRD